MKYLWTEEELEVQHAVREVFNPEDLCNPGKMLPRPARCAEVKKHAKDQDSGG